MEKESESKFDSIIIVVEERLSKKIKIINEHTETINELKINSELDKKDIEITQLKLELKIEKELRN